VEGLLSYPFLSRETSLILVLTVALEAVAAVYGPISAGLEGHLGGGSATIANHFIHLAFATIGVLAVAAGAAATGAAAGLVLEPFVSKELLLRSGKNELGATITAG